MSNQDNKIAEKKRKAEKETVMLFSFLVEMVIARFIICS